MFVKKNKNYITAAILGALLFSASPAQAWSWKQFFGISLGIIAAAVTYSWWKSPKTVNGPSDASQRNPSQNVPVQSQSDSTAPQSRPKIYDKAALESTHFDGAHVLPTVTINPANTLGIKIEQPEKFYVLGREAAGNDNGRWSALGGGSNAGENTLTAAARECYEESARLLFHASSDPQYHQHYLGVQNGNTTHVIKHTHGAFTNIVYVTQFPQSTIEKLCTHFHAVRLQETEWSFKEMDAVALVKHADFIKTVGASADARKTWVEAYVFDGEISDTYRSLSIPIRPFLVPTLQSFCKGEKTTLIFEK